MKEVPRCHIPEDRCITVVFHTFVHLPSWGCNENPKVCIRFGERDLGNWNHDFPLDIVRYVHVSFMMFMCVCIVYTIFTSLGYNRGSVVERLVMSHCSFVCSKIVIAMAHTQLRMR